VSKVTVCKILDEIESKLDKIQTYDFESSPRRDIDVDMSELADAIFDLCTLVRNRSTAMEDRMVRYREAIEGLGFKRVLER